MPDITAVEVAEFNVKWLKGRKRISEADRRTLILTEAYLSLRKVALEIHDQYLSGTITGLDKAIEEIPDNI